METQAVSGSGRGRRSSAQAALFATFLLLSQAASTQANTTDEYRAEANALSRIPSFIEWPESAFPSQNASFRICVYGNFPFGTALAELARTETAHGRGIEIRWARKDSELHDCQMVFISRSEQKNYARILGLLHGSAILSVGETQDFADSGGMVEFAYDRGSLTFAVNLTAADEAHLRISSRFLTLARRVVRNTESATKGQP